jgi:hypothetical protein
MSDNWRRITPGLCRKSLILVPFVTLCADIEDGI